MLRGHRMLIAALLALALTGSAHAGLPLTTGAKGAKVCAAQWLLSGHRPSVFRTGPLAVRTYRLSKPIPRGAGCQYGKRMTRATRDAYWKLGWPAWYVNSRAGGRYGPMLHAVLQGKATRPLAYKVTAGNRANRAQPPDTPPPTGPSAKLVANAWYLIANRSLVRYTQSPLRMMIVRLRIPLPPLRYQIWEDCSSSTTGLYWLAGLPDPNGLGYNGQGYTGTQASHGRVVWTRGQSLSQLRPGDLIFYGWRPFRHVTMYLGRGRVFSHGTDAGPYDVPALYRTDAFEARRYF